MKAVHHNDLSLAYEVYGSGPNVLIALHGHSKSPSDFEQFAQSGIRIIAPSLFHHGHSAFPKKRINKQPLTSGEFYQLMGQVLEAESVTDFHLMAYSQGGRFALKMIERWSERLVSIALLSPDGIDINGFYQRASTSRFNWALMAHFERFPKHFRTTMKLVRKLGFVNDKVLEMSTELSKSKWHMSCASESWRNFRAITSDPKKIGDLIKKNDLKFQLFMGQYDGIFPAEIAFRFVREAGLPKSCVAVLPCGHDFFKKQAVELYKNRLAFCDNSYIYAHEKADATHS